MAGKTNLRNRIARHKFIYLMMVPGFVLTFLFYYLPLHGLYMAFSDYKLGKPILAAPFAGFKYIKQVFADLPQVWTLLKNTLGMNLLQLFGGIIFAMIFVILLNEVRQHTARRVVQTSTFFPYFVSWVIVYYVFNTFFAVNGGLINVLLTDLGIIKEGVNLMGDPKYSWLLITVSYLWKTLGYNAVLFFAAITAIDPTLYEAAEMDGADRFSKMRHITLPALLPTAQILLILGAGWIFTASMEQYYVFTNQMNRPTMLVFDYYIYDTGLKQMHYSYATAVGLLKTVCGLFLLFLVNGISKKLNDTSVV